MTIGQPPGPGKCQADRVVEGIVVDAPVPMPDAPEAKKPAYPLSEKQKKKLAQKGLDGNYGLSPTSSQVELAAKKIALEALALGRGATEAARQSGIARSTIYQWMRDDPAFVRIVNENLETYRQAVQHRVQDATLRALNTLMRLMRSEDEKIQVEAARIVLSLKGSVEARKYTASVEKLMSDAGLVQKVTQTVTSETPNGPIISDL